MEPLVVEGMEGEEGVEWSLSLLKAWRVWSGA